MAHFDCLKCGAMARSKATHVWEERDLLAYEEAKARSAAKAKDRAKQAN